MMSAIDDVENTSVGNVNTDTLPVNSNQDDHSVLNVAPESDDSMNNSRSQNYKKPVADPTSNCFICSKQFARRNGVRRFDLRMDCSESTIQKVFGYKDRSHSFACYQCLSTLKMHTYPCKSTPRRRAKRRIISRCIFNSLHPSEYTRDACKGCKSIKRAKQPIQKAKQSRFCFNCGTGTCTKWNISNLCAESVIQKVFGYGERQHNYTCYNCMNFLRKHTYTSASGLVRRNLNKKCPFATLPSDEYTPLACKGCTGQGAHSKPDDGRDTPVNDRAGNMFLDDIEYERDVASYTFRRDGNDHNYTIDTTRCFVCRKKDSIVNAVTVAPEPMIQEVFNIKERKHDMVCSTCSTKLKTYVDKTNAKIKADKKKERLLKLIQETRYGDIIRALTSQQWSPILKAAGNIISRELTKIPLCAEVITELCELALQVIDKLESDLSSEIPRTKLLLNHIFKPWLVNTRVTNYSTRMSHRKYNLKHHNPAKINTDSCHTYRGSKRTSRLSESIPSSNTKSVNSENSKLGNSKSSMDTRSTSSSVVRKQNKDQEKRHLVSKVRTPSENLEPSATETASYDTITRKNLRDSTVHVSCNNKLVSKVRTPSENLELSTTGTARYDTIARENLRDSTVHVSCNDSKHLDSLNANRDFLRQTKTSIRTKQNSAAIPRKKTECEINISTVPRDTALFADKSFTFDTAQTDLSVTHKSDASKNVLSNDGSRKSEQRTKSKRIAERVEQRCKKNDLLDSPSYRKTKSFVSDVKHKPKRRRKNDDCPLTETVDAGRKTKSSISDVKHKPKGGRKNVDCPLTETVGTDRKTKSSISDVKHKPKRRRKNVDFPLTETVGAASFWGTDILIPVSKQKENNTSISSMEDDNINRFACDNQVTSPLINSSRVQDSSSMTDVITNGFAFENQVTTPVINTSRVQVKKTENSLSMRSLSTNDDQQFSDVQMDVTSFQDDLAPLLDPHFQSDLDLFDESVAVVVSNVDSVNQNIF